MPDLAPSLPCGLEQFHGPSRVGSAGEPGVTLSLRDGVALAAIIGREGKIGQLRDRFQDSIGIALPLTAKRIDSDALSVVWAGPGRWLAVAAYEAGGSLEKTLRSFSSGLASIVDQSDGQCIFRVSGPSARDALSKGLPIDLDPRTFGPGDTAMTLAGHINVHLWQIDLAPTYELSVFRSLSKSFCDWFIEVSSGYGVQMYGAE